MGALDEKAYANPEHDGNSARHHTGEECVGAGCHAPAGTAWGPYWCFAHNIERIERIDEQFKAMGPRPQP